MHRWLIISGLLLLAGCVLPGASDTGRSNNTSAVSIDGAPARSPWLNPQASIEQEVRVTTPSGIDLRQAVYIQPKPGAGAPAGSTEILLRIRDYSVRAENRPDVQRLVRLNPLTGATHQLELPETALPVRLIPGPARRQWLCSTLRLNDRGELRPSGSGLYLWDGGETYTELPADNKIALSMLNSNSVFARSIQAIKLSSGLPAVVLDRAGLGHELSLGRQEWRIAGQAGFALGPHGLQAAGYRIRYEPALPGQARIEYMAGSLLGADEEARLVAGYPYHVTYSPFAWEPPLVWADDATLVTMQFLPDATGISERANYRGLFRLVAINVPHCRTTLVEDRLSAGLPVVAGSGVVFFTRKQPAADGTFWELWCAGMDGLAKQRLASFDDNTIMMTVEDQLDGRRLLVHRQYLNLAGEEPALISELQEYSLDPLGKSDDAGALGVEPLKPFEHSSAGDDPLARFMPQSTGTGPPPISVPD